MENNENKKNIEKSFLNSDLILKNTTNLSITGVEKVYESNEKKLQLKVAGKNMIICGENLSISKLDVDKGEIEANGEISEIRYIEKSRENTNFFKKIFK